ncbi:hypothetical protein E1B28_000476 [Marasmius oreades]|uniref:Uncharacterized protein n=1 Tax=Marasmius oreades TaxID=181124 RepID=A0A9P7V1J6_9AGAR|nr:uncharacterized protein E1B28_000476 [Marasmius oreades]KAG7098540.1 hypothetical protein E1B28_000476 [Marasmius oreades]
MRKTSYVVTFFAVIVSLVLNLLSLRRVDWLVVKTPEVLRTTITFQYGLTQLCEYKVVNIPGGGENGKFSYTDYSCRKFPMRVKDACEKENESFCTAWISARYAVELGAGFAVLSLFAILVGVSTGSRRRRIWKAVAGLVMLHATFGIVAFAIVTDSKRTGTYRGTFDEAYFGVGYGLNTASWVLSVFVALGVLATGIAADLGHKWAAGNRAYRRIDG